MVIGRPESVPSCAVSRARKAKPALGLTQAPVERRHRLHHVGESSASHTQQRKIDPEQEVGTRPPLPARWPRRRSSRASKPSIGRGTARPTASPEGRSGIACQGLDRLLVGVSASKRRIDRIEQTVARTLVLGRCCTAEHRLIDPAMEGLEKADLRAKDGVKLKHGQSRLARNLGEAHRMPAAFPASFSAASMIRAGRSFFFGMTIRQQAFRLEPLPDMGAILKMRMRRAGAQPNPCGQLCVGQAHATAMTRLASIARARSGSGGKPHAGGLPPPRSRRSGGGRRR